MSSIAMGQPSRAMTAEERKVIFASSLGTVFEWYDFYIYGTLGVFLAKYFFSGVPANVAFIFTRCWPSPPASPSARWARWCSAASATSSGANTPSSSP